MSTGETIALRTDAGSVATVGVLLMFAPIALASWAGLTSAVGPWSSLVLVGGVAVSLVAIVLTAGRPAAFLSLRSDRVVLGLAPLWRTTIALDAITDISVVTVDAFRDYGGWGVKSSARSARGRLYSAGGRHGVRIRTTRGRTFVVAMRSASSAELAGDLISARTR